MKQYINGNKEVLIKLVNKKFKGAALNFEEELLLLTKEKEVLERYWKYKSKNNEFHYKKLCELNYNDLLKITGG